MSIRRLVPLLALACMMLLAFACSGNNSEDSDRKAAEVVKQVLQIGQGPDSKIDVFVNKLPDGAPDNIPIYSGARIISSFHMTEEDGDRYFVMAGTKDPMEKLLAFYEEQFDKEPWQVQGATNSEEATAIRFIRSDDANVDGTVALSKGQAAGEENNILITIQRAVENNSVKTDPFKLGEAKPLPKGFPASVPVYNNSTVTSTIWLRRVGNIDFMVTYLTKDPQAKVIDFYRSQLPQGGWKVTANKDEAGSSTLNFEDEKDAQLNGAVSAGAFDKDSSYTEVSVRVRTKSNVRTP
jgi:predicted enzyme related to lactoylglutathione lyase